MDVGSIIQVVGSSLKKGASGPRVGSIGYALGAASPNNTITVSGRRVHSCEFVVAFIRFGSGNDSRYEKKGVIALFPFIDCNTKNSALDDLCTLLQDSKFVKEVQSNYSSSKPVVVMKSVAQDYRKLSEPNQRAAVEAQINHDLIRYVNKFVEKGYYKRPTGNIFKDSDILEKLYNACHSSDSRTDFARSVSDSEDKKGWELIQLFKAARNGRDFRNNVYQNAMSLVEQCAHLLQDFGDISGYDVFSRCGLDMFSSTRTIKIAEIVLNSDALFRDMRGEYREKIRKIAETFLKITTL